MPTSRGLHIPIAIPAANASLGTPFLRAYPPILKAYNTSPELFLQVLDDSNRATAASLPLQVLGLVGDLVGFIPLAAAQIVGASVSTATKVGTVAMSKGRAELSIQCVNRTILNPGGFKVEVAKLDAVAKTTGMPILGEDSSID